VSKRWSDVQNKRGGGKVNIFVDGVGTDKKRLITFGKIGLHYLNVIN